MSDKLEDIRQKKREEILSEDQQSGDETPSEPVSVEGSSHLDELVESSNVVLVDFYADWCGPCKMLEPVVESVAAETDAAVAKVDIDQHQGLAQQNGVQGVPTLFLYADGEPVEQLVGVQDESTLKNLIEQHGG
ncbi:thioredoxin [Halomicrococcus sp. NG-SE-24]|uniref:thioredoxin n=1 Tax=Halomicrococcus sp. NG-SE-24 TaxID=3436928 RepID=UPI003D994B57